MKHLLVFTLSLCMLTTSIPIANATGSALPTNQQEECKPCQVDQNDLEDVIIQNEVYDENGELQSFEAIVPLPEGELPAPQTRGIITAILTILSTAAKACKITWLNTGGFNPCTYLAMALGRKIVNGVIQWKSSDNGKWRVTQTSYSEPIPGCQPMHSSGCHRWYYKYNYARA